MSAKTAKRISRFLFIIALTAMLAACSCEHEYDEGKIIKEATCTEKGVKVFTCKLCGEEKEESIPLAAHKYEETVTKEATHTENGEKTFTCSICGDSYTKAIPMIYSDFRNARLGDSSDKVIANESITLTDSLGNQRMLTGEDQFDGHDATIEYVFDKNNKLDTCRYRFKTVCSTTDEYLAEYNLLKESLIKEYGKPETEETKDTKSDTYDMAYVTYWETDRIKIGYKLAFKGDEVSWVLSYFLNDNTKGTSGNEKSSVLEINDFKWHRDGDWIYSEGSVKNNTSETVYYVKVKVKFKDSSGNVIDIDWTYAVGSEGLEHGESCKWDMMTKNDDRIEKASASILDDGD